LIRLVPASVFYILKVEGQPPQWSGNLPGRAADYFWAAQIFGLWLKRAFWTKAGVIEDKDSFLGLACGCGTSFLRDQEPLWRITVDAAVEDGRRVPVCGWEIEPLD